MRGNLLGLPKDLFSLSMSALGHSSPPDWGSLNARVSAAWSTLEKILSRPLDEKTGFDSKTVVLECVVPRLQRISGFCRQPTTSRFGLLASTTSTLSEYKNRMDHVELMLFLVANHNKFGSTFWTALVKWQLASYQESCIRLLENYQEMTRHISDDRRDIDIIINNLSYPVRRACNPEAASMSSNQSCADAFAIRNIYDEPELKALVESDMFTAQQRKELAEAAEDWLYQQPVFPPECYALLINQDTHSTLGPKEGPDSK